MSLSFFIPNPQFQYHEVKPLAPNEGRKMSGSSLWGARGLTPVTNLMVVPPNPGRYLSGDL